MKIRQAETEFLNLVGRTCRQASI